MTVPVVVSFDLDETLWEFRPMMDGALAETLAALSRRRPDVAWNLTVAQLHELRERVAADRTGTFEELRAESFRRALQAHGVDDPDLAAWMVTVWMEARLRTVRLHADVEPELDRLEATGAVLGAITNGNFPFARLPLARRFRFIVHAEQIGAPKPSPEPFRRAIELAGGSAQRWVHVGDDLESDVIGAQRAGLKAVWVNRAGRALPAGVRPDAELTSLGGLDETVARLLAA